MKPTIKGVKKLIKDNNISIWNKTVKCRKAGVGVEIQGYISSTVIRLLQQTYIGVYLNQDRLRVY